MARGLSTTLMVWIGTGVAVAAILGVAFFAVRGGDKAPPEPEQVLNTPAEVATHEAAPPPVVKKQEAEQHRKNPPVALVSVIPPKPLPSPDLDLHHLAGTLHVKITDTPPGGRLPREYTCYGTNESPPLAWSGAPTGSRSVAVIMERREKDKKPAPVWLLFNLAPSGGKLPADLPKLAQLTGGARHARNVYGKAQYTGPCEPHGEIPYTVRVFALDAALNVPAGAERDDLVRAMNGHILDAAEYDVVHLFKE